MASPHPTKRQSAPEPERVGPKRAPRAPHSPAARASLGQVATAQPPGRLTFRLGQAAIVGFFAWVAVLNLHENTANDIWVHLRIGRDILATGKVPLVESYSAVAAGRPFISHEWL